MTNAGLKKMIDKYGNRIIGLAPTSGRVALFGYKGSAQELPIKEALRLESFSNDPADDWYFIKKDTPIPEHLKEEFAHEYEVGFSTACIEFCIIGSIDNQMVDPINL